MEDLIRMKEIYFEKSGGMTCSIAYGKTFKEVLFSMKLAKTEKNSIKGISITKSKYEQISKDDIKKAVNDTEAEEGAVG